jgi:V8-like Glu-specific endopeptidase
VRVTRVEGNGLYYSCRTKSGQSGSPVMVAIPRNNRVDWFIIGVHNSFSKTKNIGKGVFLNNFIATLLKQYYLELTTHKLYIQEYHKLEAP